MTDYSAVPEMSYPGTHRFAIYDNNNKKVASVSWSNFGGGNNCSVHGSDVSCGHVKAARKQSDWMNG